MSADDESPHGISALEYTAYAINYISMSYIFIVQRDHVLHGFIPGSEQAGGGDSSLHLISQGLFLTDSDKSELLLYLISNLELSIFDGLAPGNRTLIIKN